MRLEPERPPDPADRALAHPGRGRHRPRRPMRRVARLLLQRLHDHPLDVLVADRARLARPRLVMQPVEAAPREPAPPLADRRARYSPARPRSPCSSAPPPPPTRSGSETPTPASSSAAEPTAQAPPAPHRSSTTSARCRHNRPQSSSMTRTTFDGQTPGPCELTTQVTSRGSSRRAGGWPVAPRRPAASSATAGSASRSKPSRPPVWRTPRHISSVVPSPQRT